jgi:hypothetical protein
MKMRYLSLFSLPLMMLTSVGGGLLSSGCGGGGGGGGTSVDPANLLSDFEDPAAATVVQLGGRNGYWYSYNGSATCAQTPANMAAYVGDTPPTPSPGMSAKMALHAVWTGCSVWGAGVGADIGQPALDGGMYTGPKVPYDVTPYTGITFYAMTSATADTKLRIKIPMTDETKIADGGSCDEAVVGVNKCSDDWEMVCQLPVSGAWTPITVKFSDATKLSRRMGPDVPLEPGPRDRRSDQSQGSELSQSRLRLDDMLAHSSADAHVRRVASPLGAPFSYLGPEARRRAIARGAPEICSAARTPSKHVSVALQHPTQHPAAPLQPRVLPVPVRTEPRNLAKVEG